MAYVGTGRNRTARIMRSVCHPGMASLIAAECVVQGIEGLHDIVEILVQEACEIRVALRRSPQGGAIVGEMARTSFDPK